MSTRPNNVWESGKYRRLAHLGSLSDHPGMDLLMAEAQKANVILDLGCGEGTRLGKIKVEYPDAECVGIDISKASIDEARHKYPGCHFSQCDISDIPFAEGKIDLVYSAFVLEHTSETEKILKEAVRVLKPNGHLLLIAPNYGAPNRASPVGKYNRIKKLVEGLLNDYLMLFKKQTGLNWQKVEPINNPVTYTMDSDTTTEPYINSLVKYLKSQEIVPIKIDSCWNMELPNPKLHQRIFRVLSNYGLYPFKYWGPHILFLGQKN